MIVGWLLLVALIGTGVALASAHRAPRLWLAASLTSSVAALAAARIQLHQLIHILRRHWAAPSAPGKRGNYLPRDRRRFLEPARRAKQDALAGRA